MADTDTAGGAHTATAHSTGLFAWLTVARQQLKRVAYEGIGRDRWQYPDRVIEALALPPGAHVADLGSGAGYFTFRLARAVGPGGVVYAVDADDDLRNFIVDRARDGRFDNVRVVRATADDALLPHASVDLVFTCNAYHHLAQRVSYFTKLRTSLRPGGRVAIMDAKRIGWFHKWFGHWTASDVIRSEMEAAGYRLQDEFAFLPRQHFLVFTAAP